MFGFSKGKIVIKPDQYQAKPGDTITGNVTVTTKKQVHATQTTIGLQAIQKTSGIRVGRNRNTGYSSNTQTAYDYKQPIDGEREYIPGQTYEFPFSIAVPTNIQQELPDGALGTAVGVLASLVGQKKSYRWYLIAAVDIPGGFDISHKVEIQVVSPAP